MFQFLYFPLQAIQLIAVPFCCFCAIAMTLLFFWSVYVGLREGVTHVKRLHQIPCAGCEFFTGDYRLKCTVRPLDALSEDAIGCQDFQPKMSAYNQPAIAPCTACHKQCLIAKS